MLAFMVNPVGIAAARGAGPTTGFFATGAFERFTAVAFDAVSVVVAEVVVEALEAMTI
jgi:hypothetical protein